MQANKSEILEVMGWTEYAIVPCGKKFQIEYVRNGARFHTAPASKAVVAAMIEGMHAAAIAALRNAREAAMAEEYPTTATLLDIIIDRDEWDEAVARMDHDDVAAKIDQSGPDFAIEIVDRIIEDAGPRVMRAIRDEFLARFDNDTEARAFLGLASAGDLVDVVALAHRAAYGEDVAADLRAEFAALGVWGSSTRQLYAAEFFHNMRLENGGF